jgi:hypothetical protein
VVEWGYKVALQLREPEVDDDGVDHGFLVTVAQGWWFWMVSVHDGVPVRVLMVGAGVRSKGRGVTGVNSGDVVPGILTMGAGERVWV